MTQLSSSRKPNQDRAIHGPRIPAVDCWKSSNAAVGILRAVGTRLQVLLGVLVLLVALFVAGRLHLFGSSSNAPKPPLSPAETQAAEQRLNAAQTVPSYEPKPCALSSPGICFHSRRPLQPMSKEAALHLAQKFLPLTDLRPEDCEARPPHYRGRHLFAATASCIGVASLGKFIASFSVLSINSECRREKRLVGTDLNINVIRVGRPAEIADSPAMREMQRMGAQTRTLAKQVLARYPRPKKTNVWPSYCR